MAQHFFLQQAGKNTMALEVSIPGHGFLGFPQLSPLLTHRPGHLWLALSQLARDQPPKSALATSSAHAQEAVFNNPFLRRYSSLSELLFLCHFYLTVGFIEGKDHFQMPLPSYKLPTTVSGI